MICKVIYILRIYLILYTLSWNTNATKISLELNKRYKKCNLFSFASFNSPQFHFLIHKSYASWSTRFVSLKIKTCAGFYTFDSASFLLKFSFSFQKKTWTLWPQNIVIPFKIKIMEVTAHTFFCSQMWFLSCSKTFENSLISVWARALQKLTWRGIFKNWKIKVLRTSVSLNRNYLVNIWNSFDY